MKLEVLKPALAEWAKEESSVEGVLLVGSHARGEARLDSDIDLVIIYDGQKDLIADQEWMERFGQVKSKSVEVWGILTSVRVFYLDDQEVEFGITTDEWIKIPLDPGTRRVVSYGAEIIVDKQGRLKDLMDYIAK